jgi:hypothetical protein
VATRAIDVGCKVASMSMIEHYGLKCPNCCHRTDASSAHTFVGRDMPHGTEFHLEIDPGPHRCPRCRALFNTILLDVELVGDELVPMVATKLLAAITKCAVAS